jgi:hypothetical protein
MNLYWLGYSSALKKEAPSSSETSIIFTISTLFCTRRLYNKVFTSY